MPRKPHVVTFALLLVQWSCGERAARKSAVEHDSVVQTVPALSSTRADKDTSLAIPRYSTPQNTPCSDQPRSIEQLVAAFDRGRQPNPREIDGTWVAIGFFDDSPSLNCSGVTRGGKVFEWVMIVDHYSIELDVIGTLTSPQTATMTSTDQSVRFPIDLGADAGPDEYRCRLTNRRTLACLTGRDDWLQGLELKMMAITDAQRASRITSR